MSATIARKRKVDCRMASFSQASNLKSFSMSALVGDLFSTAVETWEECVEVRAQNMVVEESQRACEDALLPPGQDVFEFEGYCVLCDGMMPMVTTYLYASPPGPDGRLRPNWREHIGCTTCRQSNRVRAAMHFLMANGGTTPNDRIYITERVTPLYAWLGNRFENLTGSEFFDGTLQPGATVDDLRHEDLTNLSFPDASFDLVMSFDVVEHVVDFDAALRQMARVLRPGGKLILAAPTSLDLYDTFERAKMTENGTIEHFAEPEYHGNPVDPEKGALCFRYLGVDVLDRLRTAGFERAKLALYWSRYYGYLGAGQNLFFAER